MEDYRSKIPSKTPQTVFPHLPKIAKYLFSKEKSQGNLSIDACPNLDLKERTKTIEWLSTISYNFKLLEKTLALAVETFDFYLERNSERFDVSEYQFLGLSCLFMASKYEEIYPPNAQVRSFIFKSDDKI